VSGWLSADAWAEVGLMATLVDIHNLVGMEVLGLTASYILGLKLWNQASSLVSRCFVCLGGSLFFASLPLCLSFLDPMAGLFSVSGITAYLPSMLMLSKVAKSGQPRSRTQ
jgi:hypothetical protein